MCLCILAFIPFQAHAQQKHYPIRAFVMYPIKGEAFLRGEFRLEDEQNTGSGFDSREEDLFFEEGLELRSGGYFYHPNLIEFDATLRLGLEQQRIDINDQDYDSEGTIIGYDLSAIILREKPISLRAFASATQDFLDRDFGQRLEINRTHQGLEIFSKGHYPMSLLFENFRLRQESDLRNEDQRTNQFRFTISDQRSRDWTAKLIYQHEDTDQTSIFSPPGGGADILSDLPVRRDELNINYHRRFGPAERQHRLTGNVHLTNRRGFFENERISTTQRLDLAHSDTFSSYYQLLASSDKTEAQKDQVIGGEVGFSKRFYQSLEVTGRALASGREFSDGSEDIVGAYLNMDYRKKTPLGQYIAALTLGIEHQKEKSGSGQRLILDEVVTLTGVAFSQLIEPNVVPGTIVVTNAANTVTYVEGVDYTLITIGAFTQIARLIGGGIADPETVLVDYDVQVASDAAFTTDHLDFSNRLKLKHLPLTVYYRYQLRDDRLRSGDDPGNLDTLRGQLAGVELDYKGLKLTAEHESQDQLLFPPIDSIRFKLNYSRRLSRNFNLALGTEYQRLNYDKAVQFGLDPNRAFLNTTRAYGTLTAKIRANTVLRLKSDYIRTQGRENDKLLRLGVNLEWRYRRLDFSLEARHDIFKQISNEGTSDFLGFYLRRRF